MHKAGNSSTPAGRYTKLDVILPPVLDTAVIISFFWLLPLTARWLTHGHPGNIALIAGAYLAMCGGLWLTKLIHPPVKQHATRESDTDTGGDPSNSDESTDGAGESKDDCSTQGCAPAMALPFSIFVLVMMLTSGGLLANGGAGLDALNAIGNAHPLLSVLAIVVFLLFTGAFVMALLAKPKPRLAQGSAAALAVKALGVLGIDAMVLVTAAYWEAELADSEPMGLAIGGRILVFVFAYIVFLMFYAPPRLALLSVDPGKYSLYTFLAMLAVVVWRLTA